MNVASSFSSAVSGILMGLGYGINEPNLSRASLLASPQTLVQGLQPWLFHHKLGSFGDDFTIGSFGPIYGLAWLVFTAGSVLLLLLRYKKVAR